jgi:FtsP/CotA-like multicopper oxidase with cupredoxin domain
MEMNDRGRLNRRDLLKWGSAALVGSAPVLRSALAFGQTTGPFCPPGSVEPPCFGADAIEAFPTSPFVLNPFTDPLIVPRALSPVPKLELDTWARKPGPGLGQQASDGATFSTHQIWPSKIGLPDPIIYQIRVDVDEHFFTSPLVKVQPIDAAGREILPPDDIAGPRCLPASTIYGFNGTRRPLTEGGRATFPGPMIRGEYGRPVLVRFENHLDENPKNLSRGDFGSPNYGFLTHLHNAHTAPESDGNPHHRPPGFLPREWVDNLYLNTPPADPLTGNPDPNEKQSFWWFHDHFEGHTGANVYKGLVGLMPISDPDLDPGDETKGLRLPGVRRDNPDGSFDVDYDIPLAIFDCRLDDGVTPHQDCHNGFGQVEALNWGKTFFRHFPNHGFVGDLFTVNGTAYPVLEVKRRKYRFRFLDASISRVYEFKLMSSTDGPQAAPGVDGQWLIPDGEQCMRLTQIASEGGLLPFAILRNSFTIWPAKRREFVVDFTKYMDGTPTTKGDVVYLTNILKMEDGRKPDSFDPSYKVPVLKIVIGDPAPDNSLMPTDLRPLPRIPDSAMLDRLPHRTFELQRGGSAGGEIEWLINDFPFRLGKPLALPIQGRPEVWTLKSGGGWGHPMHIHQEEHRILTRNDDPIQTPPRPPAIADGPTVDDLGKEDTVALNGSETVVLYRNFRTFEGCYVAHCHNLAHEDHSMMFGWSLLEP